MCPLCGAGEVNQNYHQDRRRDYFQCSTCHLVFVPPQHFLAANEEKAQYDLHKNSPEDDRYRQFLSRLFLPMQKRLGPKSHGLDFGSGPGPTLSVMFEEVGHSMATYDYFYAKDTSVFESFYDFITATEVVEHLHHPRQELDRLWAILKPEGRLGIMTKLVRDREAFAEWHYKNDPTHVCFYSRSTFKWLAAEWHAELAFEGNDVILFYKLPSEFPKQTPTH